MSWLDSSYSTHNFWHLRLPLCSIQGILCLLVNFLSLFLHLLLGHRLFLHFLFSSRSEATFKALSSFLSSRLCHLMLIYLLTLYSFFLPQHVHLFFSHLSIYNFLTAHGPHYSSFFLKIAFLSHVFRHLVSFSNGIADLVQHQ